MHGRFDGWVYTEQDLEVQNENSGTKFAEANGSAANGNSSVLPLPVRQGAFRRSGDRERRPPPGGSERHRSQPAGDGRQSHPRRFPDLRSRRAKEHRVVRGPLPRRGPPAGGATSTPGLRQPGRARRRARGRHRDPARRSQHPYRGRSRRAAPTPEVPGPDPARRPGRRLSDGQPPPSDRTVYQRLAEPGKAARPRRAADPNIAGVEEMAAVFSGSDPELHAYGPAERIDVPRNNWCNWPAT